MNVQLEPPPLALIQPLYELRDYYARRVEEYENLCQEARSQLAHVEVLLSSWSSKYDDTRHTIENNNQTHAHTNDESSLISNDSDKSDVSDTQELESDESEKDSDALSEDNSSYEPSTSLQDSDALSEDNSSQLEANISLPQSTYVPTSQENNDSSKVLEIPMLPQFQVLTRMQAIEKLLQEHSGSVCHIDFIVRTLYGDLEPNVFRIVKGRVHSTLTHGREKSHWAAIPDEPGCYTLDLSLVAHKNGKVKSKTVTQKRKPFVLPKTKRIPMLPEFDGQFLIDAISALLKQNSGKSFSVAEIITGLYGELDSGQLRQIKSAVLNELSRGYRIGRFSRVPEKIGYYTWDLKKIQRSTTAT